MRKVAALPIVIPKQSVSPLSLQGRHNNQVNVIIILPEMSTRGAPSDVLGPVYWIDYNILNLTFLSLGR